RSPVDPPSRAGHNGGVASGGLLAHANTRFLQWTRKEPGMQSRTFLRLTGRGFLFFSLCLLVAPRDLPAQTENLDPLEFPGVPHRHETIDVDARPIVSRLPISMI